MSAHIIFRRSWPGWAVAMTSVVVAVGCAGPVPGPVALTAEMPLHLEDHLADASIVGSEPAEDVRTPVEWSFSEPQPDWRVAPANNRVTKSATIKRSQDSLQVVLSDPNLSPLDGSFQGGLYFDLPDWDRDDWAYVLVTARTSDPFDMIRLGFNLDASPEATQRRPFPFVDGGVRTPVMGDGTVQTYALPIDRGSGEWEGPWKQLGIWFGARKPGTIDILSVRVISPEAEFAARPFGVEIVRRGTVTDPPSDAPYRRSIFMHTPGTMSFQVKVPRGGRLDVGLGVLSEEAPVSFTITMTGSDGTVETLLEETHDDRDYWQQRSMDLSHLDGQTVALEMAAESERAGAVVFWSVPTVSGRRSTGKPNVIFYVIDGAGADYMSVYGYHRRTTPNIESIAAEGAVFERAYSNSSWTQPSTASFLTSLHHSVFGGRRNGRNPVPDEVLTMAEHMHRASYLTAQLAANSWAGRVSSLERGVDVFRDFNIGNHSASSVSLHDDFWQWREAYPAEPYWVHFQTTDVHNWHHPVAPFAGLFIDPERRREAEEWLARLKATWVDWDAMRALEELGIDHVTFWDSQRDLHDETMAHQDHQLGRLVARLKAAGEWQRTLLIIASDHSIAAGAWDYNLQMRDPVPPRFYYDDAPILRPAVSRIPLIVVWPGHIAAGQRFSQPVSMIDVLPTILDLAELPMPEVMQGQSLAPLLLGEPGWEPRPVIFDEFELDPDSGEFRGRIEVIDGRWGASLQMNPDPEKPRFERPAPLLLYDLWNDPECVHSLHEERPDLVEKYSSFLEERLQAHRQMAQRFTRPEESPLDPDQLRTLQALGYVE